MLNENLNQMVQESNDRPSGIISDEEKRNEVLDKDSGADT